jgi:hypothetical protein
MWKVLSIDGLLKDPPEFQDQYNYKYNVNISVEDWKELETEPKAYENLARVRYETKDNHMCYFDFVLVKIVTVY